VKLERRLKTELGGPQLGRTGRWIRIHMTKKVLKKIWHVPLDARLSVIKSTTDFNFCNSNNFNINS
jgi:hypothetical protein